MRLGYSYRISWGGSPIFFKFNPDLPVGAAPFVTNTNPAPGAKLQLSGERYYAYVGFKTSMLLNRNPQVNEQVAVYGALAGAGVDIVPQHLRLEANGGYFDRGTNPLFFGTSVGPMGQTFTDLSGRQLRRHAAGLGVQGHLAHAVGRLQALRERSDGVGVALLHAPRLSARLQLARLGRVHRRRHHAAGRRASQLDDDAARRTRATSTCARSSATCACAATSRRAASATSS